MGNQPGKQGGKAIKQVYEVEKKSRTGWQPGVPEAPGKPMIQLSSRIAPHDDNSVTDEINLIWASPGDDGGFPITGYKIEMLDIQNGVWIEITYIEGFEPRCTLSNILYGIMYRFRAIAFNDSGPSEPSEPSDPVVIDVPGVQIAPYFVLMLNDTIALEHEKIEFRVKVLGTPKPSIQWYKDDMEIFSSERLEVREEEDGGVVVVKEARLSDSGNIKCVATNILGRATSVAQLMIEAAPRLDIPETYVDGLIFRHDAVMRLKIPMIAKPAPRVTWFFEDEPICPSEDLQIETTDTMTSIKIGSAKRWHCGEFRVLAQNENGQDTVSLLVTVTAPPSPPGKAVVIDIAGTTCILKWEPSEDDGGADVKHYLVEYFRDVWDVWLKAKTTKECQVTIEDLIPGSRYKFRVKSENAYGVSEESEESDAFDVGGVSADPGHSLSFGESDPDWAPVSIEEPAWSPSAKPKTDLKTIKRAWDSEESSEDVLKDLLRVKKLSQRVDSTESDGMPSMTSIGDEAMGSQVLSESSDLQRARKLYAELQMMSNDSAETIDVSIEGDFQDLDAAAKDFYDEIRMLSVEKGGSIENILDNIGISSESLSSLIPAGKRQELAKFEMSLKDMIEEAKMMAATPDRLLDEVHIPSQAEVIHRRKSNSAQSHDGSVVSVIEAPPELSGLASEMPMPAISVTSEDGGEPSAPGRGKIQQERGRASDRRSPQQKPPSPQADQQVPVRPEPQPELVEDIDLTRAPPLEEVYLPGKVSPREAEFMAYDSPRQSPPQAPLRQSPLQQTAVRQSPLQQAAMRQSPLQQAAAPLRQSPMQQASPVRQTPPQPMQPMAPGRKPGFRPKESEAEREERQKSVGSDRYEEIIQTRKRSVSRPRSGMGSRTNSQNDFRSSQLNNFQNENGRLDLEALRASIPRSIVEPAKPTPPATNGYQAIPPKVTSPTLPPVMPASPSPVKPIPPPAPPKVLPPIAFDANQNSTPVVPPTPSLLSHPAAQPGPPSDDALVRLFPQNIPHWFVITYTYSVVLIMILLIANVTPDGKLYIHFTAFWSLVLYFFLEDDQTCDILDTMIDKYIKK